MNPNNNPTEPQETPEQPETFLDECRNLVKLNRVQGAALIIATIGGAAAAHAAIDQPDKSRQKDADVYSMSVDELARYKPSLPEFVTGKREETGEMVAEADEVGKELPEKCKANLNKCLFGAAKEGDLDAVKSLIEKGADINAKDSDGRTPLMYASSYGYTEIVKLLIEKGAYVDAKDPKGWTSLMYAVFDGNTETVKLLIEKGADVNAKSDFGCWTSLILAARDGNTEIVKLLIGKGADLSLKTEDGKTALDLAREKGHTDVIELLEQAESSQP